MANPQKEDGYTMIANEIMDALARIRIPGEARQILDFILRKTYGFNKKSDAISLSQFCNGTNLKKQTVCKAINKLKTLNIITQKDNKVATEYSINKDFDKWVPLPKKVTKKSLPKKEIDITQKANNLNPIGDIQKTVTKDTLTKDNMQTPFAEGINEIMDLFYKINPSLNYANITERKAVDWILNKWGLEECKRMVGQALLIQGKPYAPVITKPTEFKDKIAKIKLYFEQQTNIPNKGINVLNVWPNTASN